MSSFGRLFRVTTFGESHCPAVGCIVEGVPPRMQLSADDIQPQLSRRRPGQSHLTTQRKESDAVSILSGVECGITLGTPIALVIPNFDQKPSDYTHPTPTTQSTQSTPAPKTKTSDAPATGTAAVAAAESKHSTDGGGGGAGAVSSSLVLIPRPSHGDYTYQHKYGVRATSGGGRASARETAARVSLCIAHDTCIVSCCSLRFSFSDCVRLCGMQTGGSGCGGRKVAPRTGTITPGVL